MSIQASEAATKLLQVLILFRYSSSILVQLELPFVFVVLHQSLGGGSSSSSSH
jgi:hypothetical protein